MRYGTRHIAQWVGLAVLLAGLAVQAVYAQLPPVGVSPSHAVPETGGDRASASAVLMPEQEGEVRKPEEPRIKSVIFSPEEINEIRLAMSAYTKNTSGRQHELTLDEEAFLKQLTEVVKDKKAEAGPKYFTYPQFYLASLVYHAPGNWSVVVNDRKFTPETAQTAEDLHILALDEGKVQLEWKPLQFEKVREAWAISHNPAIEVDLKHGVVSFTLRPNQTFSSYAMRVLEGKFSPMVVDLNAPGNTRLILQETPEEPPIEGLDPQAVPGADKQDADGNKEGLGGLIGAYKNTGEEKKP